MHQNVQSMMTEIKSIKLQMEEQRKALSKLTDLALLNPAQSCQQLKDLGLTQNGLYPLRGSSGQPASYRRCEFSENNASDCKRHQIVKSNTIVSIVSIKFTFQLWSYW